MAEANGTFRNWLAESHPGAVLLEGPEFDGGILGVTEADRG